MTLNVGSARDEWNECWEGMLWDNYDLELLKLFFSNVTLEEYQLK